MPKEVKRKSCFVVSPIGAEGSSTRARSDKVLRHIITPPVEAAGYAIIRADKIADPGLISSQVIERIAEDDLVVADLTDHNPNVFYELAIRHTLGKPYIQLIDVSQTIPFDIAGFRTIMFDYTDLDSAEQARFDIASQIESINQEGFKVVTPLTFTADINSLKASGDIEQVALSKVLDAVSSMKSQMHSLEYRMSDRGVDRKNLDEIVAENSMLKDRLAYYQMKDEVKRAKSFGLGEEIARFSAKAGRRNSDQGDGQT